MQILSTTKMSSKGQVVIPEEIRNKLGLTSGSRFVVVGDDDVIIMKTINQPSMRDFDTLIAVPGTFSTKGHIFWGIGGVSCLWVRK